VKLRRVRVKHLQMGCRSGFGVKIRMKQKLQAKIWLKLFCFIDFG
jgi:hypothetical protein